MTVLPLKPTYDELRITVSSAELVLPGLNKVEELILACEISSLPNHNCNLVFKRAEARGEFNGKMLFKANRPLVNAYFTLSFPDFQKLETMCVEGEPVRPITIYLKIEKSREVHNGEVLVTGNDFALSVCDISWRRPLF
jgi:hypothetical protein